MNDSTPFFSIIIPIYNVEKYIKKCINSVLKQKFQLYEMILVDDGSIDYSSTIADTFAHDYPDKCKVIHKKNGGLSMARNDGIDLATGEYIIFLDSDDWIENSDTLEVLHNKIVEKNYPNVILNLMQTCVDGSDKVENCSYKFNLDWSDLEPCDLMHKLLTMEGNFLGAQVFVVKHSALVDEKLFFYKDLYHEDNLWIAELFMRTDRVVLNNQYLFCYRKERTDSIMSSTSIRKNQDMLKIIDILEKESQGLDEQRKTTINFFVRILYHQVMKNGCKIEFDNATFEMATMKLYLLKYGTLMDKGIFIFANAFGLRSTIRILRLMSRCTD